MENKVVFISYKAEEYEEASWVKSTLEANGISCWMAPTSIRGGSSYAEEIPKAIRNCKVFVLILSDKAQDSKWVPRELDQAINESKIVMPFMLENCSLKDDFNFYLTNVQRYAAYENKSAAMEKMIREIKAITKIEKIEAEPQESTLELTEENKKLQCGTNSQEKKEHEIKKHMPKSKPDKSTSFVPKTKNKKFLQAVIGVALGVILIIAVSLIAWFTSTVNVAGERISKSETFLHLVDVILTDEDLNSISKLKKLSSVNIENVAFPDSDIGLFGTLDLNDLKLINCNLTDEHIKSIDFTKSGINTLDVSNNPQITDLSSVTADNIDLISINFSGTAVSDIDFLSSSKDIYSISANNAALDGELDFSGFAELNNLELNGNKITSLNLSQCKELKTLQVNNNTLSDLNGLADCINLAELYAGYNKITDISGLANATVLKNVFLNNNKLKDISVLSKSAATLQRVYIADNEITDCSLLAESSALTYFVADNNKLTELEFLSENTSLRGISVKGNEITSAEPIKQCAQLTYPDLSENSIDDASFFAEMKFTGEYGVIINLSNNEIKNIVVPTFKCKYLSLFGNPIESIEKIEKVGDGTVVFNYSESIDFNAIYQSAIFSVKLVGCPLDKQVSLEKLLQGQGIKFISSEEAAEDFKNYASEIKWGEGNAE